MYLIVLKNNALPAKAILDTTDDFHEALEMYNRGEHCDIVHVDSWKDRGVKKEPNG